MSAPEEEPASGVEIEPSVEDRGSFSHAVCRVCGWAGPGRRSRQLARRDADEHLDGGCPLP